MRLLILEDDRDRIDWFVKNFALHFLYVCWTAEDAIKTLRSENYDAIFLDHDLQDKHYAIYHECEQARDFVPHIGKFDKESGMAVAKFLADNPDRSRNAKIFLHSQNHWQVKRMVHELRYTKPCG